MLLVVVSAKEAKQLLKALAVPWGLVLVLLLSRETTVGVLKATVLREIRDLISFHVFLILYEFVSK